MLVGARPRPAAVGGVIDSGGGGRPLLGGSDRNRSRRGGFGAASEAWRGVGVMPLAALPTGGHEPVGSGRLPAGSGRSFHGCGRQPRAASARRGGRRCRRPPWVTAAGPLVRRRGQSGRVGRLSVPRAQPAPRPPTGGPTHPRCRCRRRFCRPAMASTRGTGRCPPPPPAGRPAVASL